MSSSFGTDPDAAAARGDGPGGHAHPLSVLLPGVRARLAEDAGAGLVSVSDEEIGGLLDQAEGLAGQVEALRLALVEQARVRGLGKSAGAASTASWLAGTSGRHPAGCGRDVRLARALDAESLQPTRDALAAGSICPDQARVIATAIDDLPGEASPAIRAKAQAHLLDQAAVFNARDLAVLGRRILEVVDPDLADRVLAKKLVDDEAKAERARELSLSPDPATGGLGTRLRGRLDPETAEMLRTALDPLARPRPTDADGPDTRTAAQRRGDGLHELLRRYLASGASPASHGLQPQVVVTVTDRDLINGTRLARYLHSGIPISARTAARYACNGQLRLHQPHDTAADTMASTAASSVQSRNTSTATGNAESDRTGGAILTDPVRFFTGRLRRLLELRDRGCVFPGCDRPPSWCEGHHILAWQAGGRTSLKNGVLLCDYHHRLLHDTPWAIRMASDGHPDFIPPDYIDPRHKTLRNTRLRL